MIFLHSKFEHKTARRFSPAINNRQWYSCNAWNTNIFDRSLAVQTIPHKVCSGDCIYCPFGATTRKTIDRECFFPTRKILSDLEDRLCRNAPVERIVIGGPGEPTLHSDLGSVIDGIKKITPAPVTVASCGSLLWRRSVQQDLKRADVVFANIDAADKETFQAVNHFHVQIPYLRFIEGVFDFRARFKGSLMVRVCLIEGINALEPHVVRLALLIKRLAPKAVFVGTCFVPDIWSTATPVETVRLQYLASHFGPNVHVVNSPSSTVSHQKEEVCFE